MTLNFDIGVWLWVTTPRDMLLFNLWSRSMTLAHCSQRFAINFKLKAYPVQQHFLSPLILKWQNTKVWARGDHSEITYAIDKDVLTMKLVSWFKVTAHLLPTSTWSVKPNKALERKKIFTGKRSVVNFNIKTYLKLIVDILYQKSLRMNQKGPTSK